MTKGYQNYRGRDGKRWLLAIPLALALLLSLGYLFIENFVVYDARGNAEIDWPFSWGLPRCWIPPIPSMSTICWAF